MTPDDGPVRTRSTTRTGPRTGSRNAGGLVRHAPNCWLVAPCLHHLLASLHPRGIRHQQHAVIAS